LKNGKTVILFVAIELEGGGAQRVLATILQHLDRTKFESVLALFMDIRQFQIPESVQVISLQKKGWWDYPKLIWKLSRLYTQLEPDVVLSLLTYTNVICVLAKVFSKTRIRLILCEHGLPSFFLKQTKNPITILFLKWMPRWFYNRADNIVCVSRDLANEVNKIFNVPFTKIKIIHNPIDIDNIVHLGIENVEHPWFAQNVPIIISVGRLVDVKGYEYLLRAFKQILTHYPSRLVILGQGEKEESLKALTLQLDIDKSVAFLGFQINPFKYMSRSRVFVLSSLSEAFPMVIVEAMACGIPVISTASSGGNEIITHGINGLLVPIADEKSLAKAILKLLTDNTLPTSLVRLGKKRVCDFSVEKIINEYEELLQTDGQLANKSI